MISFSQPQTRERAFPPDQAHRQHTPKRPLLMKIGRVSAIPLAGRVHRREHGADLFGDAGWIRSRLTRGPAASHPQIRWHWHRAWILGAKGYRLATRWSTSRTASQAKTKPPASTRASTSEAGWEAPGSLGLLSDLRKAQPRTSVRTISRGSRTAESTPLARHRLCVSLLLWSRAASVSSNRRT